MIGFMGPLSGVLAELADVQGGGFDAATDALSRHLTPKIERSSTSSGTLVTHLSVTGPGVLHDIIASAVTAISTVQITVDGVVINTGSGVLAGNTYRLYRDRAADNDRTAIFTSVTDGEHADIPFKSSLLIEHSCSGGTSTIKAIYSLKE